MTAAVAIYVAAAALVFGLAMYLAILIIEPNNNSNKLVSALVIGLILAGAGHVGLFYTWFLLIPLGYVLISQYDLGMFATVAVLVGLGFLATIIGDAIAISFDWLNAQGIEFPRLSA